MNRYLREMIYSNKEITELFDEETIHVIDYDLEYDKGYPDAEEFPEFNNKLWSELSTSSSPLLCCALLYCLKTTV